MINPTALFEKYGHEDTITGWDAGAGDWPIGSIWGVEGQYLYSIVRETQPARVLELGTFHGCSATHIATALLKNGKGKLTCVDNAWDFRPGVATGTVGHMIPDDLRATINFIDKDIPTYIGSLKPKSVKSKFDIIFEDGDHDPKTIEIVWSRARKLLKPGGLLITHDAMHDLVGQGIREAIEALGFEPLYLKPNPSDCGFAIWENS
jgi:predicted O-methyltransferase YrrM